MIRAEAADGPRAINLPVHEALPGRIGAGDQVMNCRRGSRAFVPFTLALLAVQADAQTAEVFPGPALPEYESLLPDPPGPVEITGTLEMTADGWRLTPALYQAWSGGLPGGPQAGHP
jgi:hypothetical protein